MKGFIATMESSRQAKHITEIAKHTLYHGTDCEKCIAACTGAMNALFSVKHFGWIFKVTNADGAVVYTNEC